MRNDITIDYGGPPPVWLPIDYPSSPPRPVPNGIDNKAHDPSDAGDYRPVKVSSMADKKSKQPLGHGLLKWFDENPGKTYLGIICSLLAIIGLGGRWYLSHVWDSTEKSGQQIASTRELLLTTKTELKDEIAKTRTELVDALHRSEEKLGNAIELVKEANLKTNMGLAEANGYLKSIAERQQNPQLAPSPQPTLAPKQ